MDKNKIIPKSSLAGILIGIGCCINLSCDNKYIGAFLFSFALLSICYLNGYLFTGKVGYASSKQDWKNLGQCLMENLVAADCITYLYGCMKRNDPAFINKVNSLHIEQRIERNLFDTFFLAIMCGVIMFIAVETFKKGSIAGILIGIPTFILCGFEHSIADWGYIGAYVATCQHIELRGLLFMIVVIIGNALGSLSARFAYTEVDLCK